MLHTGSVQYYRTRSRCSISVALLVFKLCSIPEHMFLNTCKRSVPSDQLVFFLMKPFSTWCSKCSIPLNTMVFNITEHVQGVQYLLRFWRSDGVLNLNTHFYSFVFDLLCIFRENTHEQQLIQAKILYQCPSRNILDFVYGGSHFSTGVIFLRVRHVKNRPLWHFFYTWDTFFYDQGSFLYDEKWPLGRFSTGVVIRRYTGSLRPHQIFTTNYFTTSTMCYR